MDKEKFFEEFNNGLHRIGRIAMIAMVALLVSIPFLFGAMNNLSPDWKAVLSGMLRVGIIYYPVSIVEFLIYTPMLGVGGSYLSFITGNITNMRIPCAMNAATIAKTQPGTAEHEIVNTIAVATSAITTTLVIVVGVVALVPLQPVLQNPVLQPAFDNVVPALFGALAYQYFRKGIKIVAIPLVVMTVLCVAMPSLIGSVGFLIIPSGAMAIGVGYVLWKRENKKEAAE